MQPKSVREKIKNQQEDSSVATINEKIQELIDLICKQGEENLPEEKITLIDALRQFQSCEPSNQPLIGTNEIYEKLKKTFNSSPNRT